MGKIRSQAWVVLAVFTSSALIGCSGTNGHQESTATGRARLPIALLSTSDKSPPRSVLLPTSKAMRLPAEKLAKEAHRASTHYGPVWLVPVGETLCLLTKLRPGYSCSPDGSVLRHGLTIGLVINPGSRSSRYFVLFGIVQNKVKRVALKIGQRKCASVPVRNNVFSFRSTQPVWLTGATVGQRPVCS